MSSVAIIIGFFVGLLCRAMSKDLSTWLKTRLHRPPPVNALESGILLPDPADPRWRTDTVTFKVSSTQIKTRCLVLGEIKLCRDHRDIFIGEGRALPTTPRTLQYITAVENAYRGRLALKSLGVEDC